MPKTKDLQGRLRSAELLIEMHEEPIRAQPLPSVLALRTRRVRTKQTLSFTTKTATLPFAFPCAARVPLQMCKPVRAPL